MHDAIDAYLLFTDKNHDRLSGFRRAQFRHVVLLEQDAIESERWLLRQWRNGRELTRGIMANDFYNSRNEPIDLIEAIKRGMLDVDMNGEADLDVRIMEVRIPQIGRPRLFARFRANDLGYVKWRLGMGLSHWRIRKPYQLYKLFEEHGPNAAAKTAWRMPSLWSLLWGGIKLMRKARV
ncbi:MAG: hypothetical protein OEU92_22290 [Alphaproteobacteria bacterium]|nr:hypothetical protein [Alphaproteobacteria bacterium]